MFVRDWAWVILADVELVDKRIVIAQPDRQHIAHHIFQRFGQGFGLGAVDVDNPFGQPGDIFRGVDGKTETVQTFPQGRIIVGRSPDNEIYIKSKFVSRHHMQLVDDGGHCVIEDLNSTNGVFIGESQVKKRKLADGDIIRLGAHELVYTNLRETGDVIPQEEDFEDTHDDVPPVVGKSKARQTPA